MSAAIDDHILMSWKPDRISGLALIVVNRMFPLAGQSVKLRRERADEQMTTGAAGAVMNRVSLSRFRELAERESRHVENTR